MMKAPLDISIDSRGVCRLTLNRHQCGNALDGVLIQQLLEALAKVRTNPAIRVLILTGHGKLFCSGADLQWMKQMVESDSASNEKDALELATLLEELAGLPIPTVARINGPAYGGAGGLICACDIAIACNSANFTFSEVRLGLIPAVIAPYVVAAIGLRQTRRWFLSGESMAGELAQQLGLVHKRVAKNELDEAVEHQVQLLLKGGPRAQAKLKGIMHQWLLASPCSKEQTAELLATVRASDEGHEGLAAFLEKRNPGWSR